MATDAQPLITLGPFLGLDSHTADIFEQSGYGTTVSNVDTGRNTDSLMNFRGRTQLAAFPMLGPGNNIASLARLDVSPTLTFYIVQGANSPYITGWWSPQLNSSGVLTNITTRWLRGVQFQGVLYLDSGHQVFPYEASISSCQWQYPAPTGGFGYSLISSTNPLVAATYSYAFVRVLTIPAAPYNFFQQTTPYYLSSNASYSTNEYGTVTYSAGTLIVNGEQAIELYGDFYGTTPDGIAYTTDIYRMSSNSNVFNYLASVISGAESYIDTATDQSIAANQQLVLNRDPPPTGITDIGPTGPTYIPNAIESLLDRMFVLARQQNSANTYDIPQKQLWYSEVGNGWSFDAALQVTLVSQESTTAVGEPFSTTVPPVGYGDQVSAICRIASQLLIWGQSSTSILYGTDESNFTVLPLFRNVGCVAPLSPVQIREGIVGWLSSLGAFIYNQVQLIDVTTEHMRNALNAIPTEHWPYAVSSFNANRWMISFPLDNITLVAYFPTEKGQLNLNEPRWSTLPYAMTAQASGSSLQRDSSSTSLYEQLVGARPLSQYIDYWRDTDSDLGEPITLTWTSPITPSQAPFGQKTYRTLSVMAPEQPTLLTVTLSVDPGFSTSPAPWVSGVIDLSEAPTTKVINIPNGACKGYGAQLTLSATNNGTEPIEIWSVIVGGTVDRTWVTNA